MAIGLRWRLLAAIGDNGKSGGATHRMETGGFRRFQKEERRRLWRTLMYQKMDAGDGADLNRLLTELHAKRRWLDEVIRGLEEVIQSPELKFVTAITEVFGEEDSPRPKIDLETGRKRRLSRLASRITGSRNRPGGSTGAGQG